MDSTGAILFCLVLCIGVISAASSDCADHVVFCYYNSESNTRNSSGTFGVSDLPTDLCTHIAYSYIGVTGEGEVSLISTQQTLNGKSNTIEDFAALKDSSSSVKYLVSIGGYGWNSTNFTNVVNNDTLRPTFVSNIVSYLGETGLDGLDLNSGGTADKEYFSSLLKELKEAFSSSGYLITATVGATQSDIDSFYNVTVLNEYADYINLLSFEYHGIWDDFIGVNAPMYAQVTDSNTTNLNVNNTVYTWIENGASASKLVLGLAPYGKTYTLSVTTQNTTGADFTMAGIAGPYVAQRGIWSYYEICADQTANSTDWTIVEEGDSYVYAFKDSFWVGYDNNNTIYTKAQFAGTMGLAGIMCWSVDLDDFGALCGSTYPMLNQGIAGFEATATTEACTTSSTEETTTTTEATTTTTEATTTTTEAATTTEATSVVSAVTSTVTGTLGAVTSGVTSTLSALLG